MNVKKKELYLIDILFDIGTVNIQQQQQQNLLHYKRLTHLSEFSWASQLWFPNKTWRKVYIEKEKVGKARIVACLARLPFFIVESNYKQGFLGWNHHCVLLSYVSVMLSDIIIALMRGNTK